MTIEAPYRFFATTVNLLTSCDAQGNQNVMACEWTLCVNFKPLHVMCIVGRENLTYDYILATREFGVNMSTDTQAGMVWLAGNHSGRDLQKLLDERFAGQTYAAERIKPMMIHGCVLNAECVVFQTFELGEYTAFVGEALVARTNPDAIPLFYTRGKYFRMGEQLPKS